MLASFAPSARANIRAGQRRGVRVHVGSDLGDLQQFHALHCATRKYKYRLLPQALDFFEAIHHHFSKTGDIFVALASDGDDVIGGAIYLRWNDVLYYKFGASALSRLSLRPNEAVHWAGLRLAHELGCSRLDWGVSDLDQPGLISYKAKFATEDGEVVVLRHQPSGLAPAVDTSWLHHLTALLTRDDVADDVTKAAGEILYRFFA
jgi:lipid II:glycine glycyltransferase (peptidoglycan interpeptide bridge formation enzyme)